MSLDKQVRLNPGWSNSIYGCERGSRNEGKKETIREATEKEEMEGRKERGERQK